MEVRETLQDALRAMGWPGKAEHRPPCCRRSMPSFAIVKLTEEEAERFEADYACAACLAGPPVAQVVPISLLDVERQIDAERDARIDGGFSFMGHRFQSRPSDRENVMGEAQLALAAIAQGAQAGDLRWANPTQDFAWITADNQMVALDAFQVVGLFQAGVAFKSALTLHARGLKDAAAEAEDLSAFEWCSGWPE